MEFFVSVFAGGGDCVEDFGLLRSDEGLKKLGLRVPSPEAALCFLNAFHEEKLLGRNGKCAIFIGPGDVDTFDLKTSNNDRTQPHGF